MYWSRNRCPETCAVPISCGQSKRARDRPANGKPPSDPDPQGEDRDQSDVSAQDDLPVRREQEGRQDLIACGVDFQETQREARDAIAQEGTEPQPDDRDQCVLSHELSEQRAPAGPKRAQDGHL